jgi:hypothetical protein
MSYFRAVQFITTSGGVKAFQFNAEGPQMCAQDYLQALAEGDISGHVPWAKYGRVGGVTNALVDVWDYGATVPTYTFSTGAATIRIVSASTKDDAGGTGASKIKIEGLLAAYAEHTEEITMDGTVAVTSTSLFLRVNKAWVSEGTAAEGQIRIYHGTSTSPTYAVISSGFTQSRQAIYTVPAGKTLYITSVRYSAGVGNTAATAKNNYVVFTDRATVDPGSGAAATLFYPLHEIGLVNGPFVLPLEMPTKIPATADLRVQAQGDTAQAVTCTAALRGWLE